MESQELTSAESVLSSSAGVASSSAGLTQGRAELKLSQCIPGQTAVIRRLGSCSSLLRAKLCSMGLCPGHEVKILYRAPLGDPITVRVLGSQLALRLSEAANIFVDLQA